MKTLIVALMMVVPVSVAAEESKDLGPEMCAALGQMSESIMLSRQVGVPLSQMIEITSNEGEDEELQKTIRKIVLAAYDEPRYNSVDYQQQAAQEFNNKVVLECLRSFE